MMDPLSSKGGAIPIRLLHENTPRVPMQFFDWNSGIHKERFLNLLI
jgi:hypothetical protein